MCQAALLVVLLLAGVSPAYAQPDATVNTRLDVRQIMVGDQARLFIEVKNKPALGTLYWAKIPDTFNKLEVVERGKIDTLVAGDVVTYKQRLLVTGFDSGMFRIPSFFFPMRTPAGDSFYVQTDSFDLLVQTVAVDTTQNFKPIKSIIYVKPSWLDHIWYIVGALALIVITALVIVYLVKNKKPAPVVPEGPKETLQQHSLRMLNELEAKQLWQNQQVKEYYSELTDIVRNYIEARFATPAMELTTDELLHKAQMHRDLMPYYGILSTILHTADLAKFAKAQPLPQEHTDAIDKARQLVVSSTPVITEPPTEKTI
ncbi:hypothetical protein GCM10023093_24960 [Nemorincola caseinilytica]|uniref:Protein BatD n=1 Tax=Nemorincola caseinilytica TaxID=2054315 RepID=A0ABP8NM19_9BACT